jgi:hypothetical protein
MSSIFISPEFLPQPSASQPRHRLARFLRRLLAPTLRGQWYDAKGNRIGNAVRLPRAGVRPIEYGNGSGGYAIAETAEPLRIDAEVPQGADYLRITLGAARFVSDVPFAALKRKLPPGPAQEKPFPPGGGPFRIDVISERFDSAPEFFTLVESLYDYWTTQQFPFTEASIKAVFSIRALFWSSDTVRGNFHTPDSAITGRILQGDGVLVRAYQEAHGGPADFALVLINSDRRAGAGGAVFKNDWQPAWATIKADANEDWRAVALHEFGHAFGLADEYDAPPYDLPITHFEPNVSKQPLCGDAPDPWAKMCAGATGEYVRLFADTRSVSAILGARYSENGWYRPQPDCLMRTSTANFCPVCAEYLGRRMLGHIAAPSDLRPHGNTATPLAAVG